MKKMYVLTALSFFLFSCEDDTESQLNSLGSEIRFSLSEYLEPQQQNLTFKFLTEKDFPCINYQIAHRVERTGSTITISLDHINKADICLDAIGPATAFIDMGNLAEGDYELNLQVGEALVNQGQLRVTAQAYVLDMPETKGLIIENTTLLRVPENIIWGTVRYQKEDQQAFSTLLSSLQSAGASEKRLAEGNYYYFDIDAAGRIRSKNSGTDVSEETFLLEFSGQNDQIDQVLGQLQQAYGEDVVVRVYNTQGDEFSTAQF